MQVYCILISTNSQHLEREDVYQNSYNHDKAKLGRLCSLDVGSWKLAESVSGNTLEAAGEGETYGVQSKLLLTLHLHQCRL